MIYRTFYTSVKMHVNEKGFVYVSHDFNGNFRSMTRMTSQLTPIDFCACLQGEALVCLSVCLSGCMLKTLHISEIEILKFLEISLIV